MNERICVFQDAPGLPGGAYIDILTSKSGLPQLRGVLHGYFDDWEWVSCLMKASCRLP